MGVNAVVLVGRLTRDPELTFTGQGHAVANMGIAVDRMTKKEDGTHETDFFNVIAWRKTAEFAGQYLKKGRLVCVEGRIQNRQWNDQATGATRKATEIIAERIQGLDKPSGDTQTHKAHNGDNDTVHSTVHQDGGDDPFADE